MKSDFLKGLAVGLLGAIWLAAIFSNISTDQPAMLAKEKTFITLGWNPDLKHANEYKRAGELNGDWIHKTYKDKMEYEAACSRVQKTLKE